MGRAKWMVPLMGLWAIPVVFTALERHMQLLGKGVSSQWTDHLGMGLPDGFLWLALSPVVLTLGERRPFGDERFVQTLLFHVSMAFLLTLCHDLALKLFNWWRHPDPGPFVFFSLRWFNGWLRSPWPGEYALLLGLNQIWLWRGRMRDQRNRESRLRESLLEARMASLKMHLQPHFLFNTLQTINSHAFRGDTATVSRLLEKLGDLLRSVLDGEGKPWGTIAEERAFLERYLEFEALRFQDRLSIVWDIDPRAETVRMPHLLLQPLVENALAHGIGKKMEGGILELRAHVNGDRLIVEIVDNGPGFADMPGEGMGLEHTRTRLALLYPDDHRFEIQSGQDGGAHVIVDLPSRRG